MRAKIFHKKYCLSSEGCAEETTEFRQLSPDGFGYWLNPGEAIFQTFLPLTDAGEDKEKQPKLFAKESVFTENQADCRPFFAENTSESKAKTIYLQSAENTFSVYASAQKAQNFLGKNTIGFSLFSENNTLNIEPKAVIFFREYYLKQLKEQTEDQEETALNLEISEIIQKIIQDSKKLPVLHKYTLRLFDLLPKNPSKKLADAQLRLIEEIIDHYTEKVTQLKPHALERKGLLNRVHNALYSLNEAVYRISKHRKLQQERIENMKSIDEDAIFYYVYALLHHCVYKQRFRNDLQRSLPKIPLCPDFFRWVGFGEQLMQLHLGKAAADFLQTDIDFPQKPAGNFSFKAKQDEYCLYLNRSAKVSLPKSVWHYRIGGLSAAERLVLQLKTEQKQRILPYEEVKSMVKKVVFVSEQTCKIVAELSKLPLF